MRCTNDVSLRLPQAEDAAAIAKYANDRAVWINLRDRLPHPYSIADAVSWIDSVQSQDPAVDFIIDVNGEAVGGIGLTLGHDIERCSAEVGYWLGSEHWGRGIATAALSRICEYAFEHLGLLRVFATPIVWNPASFRVLEKAGFYREGVMRSACIKDGTVADMALYAKVSPSVEPVAEGCIEKWFPIQTERLLLRDFTAEDEADVHEYAADPSVSQYMEWGPNTTEITAQHIRRRLQGQRAWPRDEVTLAIELRDEGKLIGAFRFDILDRVNRVAEFGFVINRRYWNRGYATEATRAVFERAFGAMKLHRIIATCDTRNVRSARVMEKVGMQREALFRKDVFQKGKWRDSYLYAMLTPSPDTVTFPR